MENERGLQKFRWTINEFTWLKANELYSDWFLLAGYIWRIVVRTRENKLSLYLDVPSSSALPLGWSRDVSFSLALIDQVHGHNTIKKDTKHHYIAKESCWGFVSFVSLCQLIDPSKGYLLKDTCIIEAEVSVSDNQEKADSFTCVKVAQDKDLAEQIGTNIYFDLVDFSKVRSFHVQSQIPFNLFKVVVANDFRFPVKHVRFWIWSKRQNRTFRPYRLVTKEEEEEHVEVLKKVHGEVELFLFLEVVFGLDVHPISPPVKTRGNILLFFKIYDPEKESLRYAGRLLVKQTATPMTIIEKLKQMVGFSCDEDIELYEEVKSEPSVMCLLVDKLISFQSSQLQDGDILCFQKSPQDYGDKDCLLPDVPSFLEHVHNRQIVCFRSLERPNEDGFYLELSKVNSCDEVVERLAHHIGLDDPSKIRLRSYNCFSQQPNPAPIRYRDVKNLLGMLVNCNQKSDILYYEVLGTPGPLPESQYLKYLRVAFYDSTKNEVVTFNIRMSKHSTVGDMTNQFKTKLQLSPDANLRLLQVLDHKIYKIYSFDEIIENINDQCTLRVIEMPEEKSPGPSDIWIQACHFFTETGHKNHNQMKIRSCGEPFVLVIHEGDTLADVKVRIQRKLHVPAKEFCKWKFAYLALDHPEYLQDSDVLSNRFQRKDVCSWDQILVLEHYVNDPRIVYALDQVLTVDPPKEAEEVPTKLTGELVDFRGLVNIDKAYQPLLEEVCTWHPALIQCQQKRSGVFKQWAFTALGQVLHFLKTTKVRDMTEAACQHLQVLWEELESSRFDLSWLAPHVEYAFRVKSYCEKADKVRKLKNNVKALEQQTRRLRAELEISELDLELAKSDLAKEEEDYEERDLDTLLGYGSG